MRRKRFLAPVCVLVLAAGCAGQQEPGEAAATPSSTARSTTAVPEETSPGEPKITYTPLPPAAPVELEVIDQRPAHPSVAVRTNGRYLAYMEPGGPDKAGAQRVWVVDGQHTVFDRTPTDRGYFVQDIWLDDGLLMMEQINVDERLVRLRVFALPSGAERPYPEAARPTQPEIDVDDGRAAVVTGTHQSGMCLRLVELRAATSREVACAKPGGVMADVAIHGTDAAYSVLVNHDRRKARCKRLFVVRDGAAPAEITLRQPCIGWSTALTTDAVAWDEMNPFGHSLEEAKAYIGTGDEIVELKKIDTDSTVSCGGMLYWLGGDGRGSRVDRFDPDRGRQIVWAPPTDDTVIFGLHCTEDRWLTFSGTELTGRDEQQVTYTVDTTQ